MKRVIFDIILFISVFIFPWWISAILLLGGIFLFNKFYEFIIASVIIFALYSVPGVRWISSPVIFSLFIIIFYIMVEYFKNRIILYKK